MTALGQARALVVVGEDQIQASQTLFDEMIDGWNSQQLARRLNPGTIRTRERIVRRFQAFCGTWPWAWSAPQSDSWFAQGEWTHSTMRGYQNALMAFMDYLCDPRYYWAQTCIERVGRAPTQFLDEWNSATHVQEFETRPRRRPFTREELQRFFDVADAQVEEAATSSKKGWLSMFRDATMVKVIYAYGLRRNEAVMLDLGDFGPNPAAPELGAFGVCYVRFGKALKGSPPRSRPVATVIPWSVEILRQYVKEIRPLHPASTQNSAMWLSERGDRISTRSIDLRFATWRTMADLPPELTLHSLRHSYVTHLTEDGVDPKFIQDQVGHAFASTSAIYTSVGADFSNRALRAALDKAFEKEKER